MTRKKVAATVKNYENENDIVLEWIWADFKYTAKHAAEKKILVTRIILVSCQKRQKVKDDDSMGLKLPKAARKNHNVCKNTVIQVLIYMYM